MNLNSVLSQLITKDISFPALKLAWDSQIHLPDIGILPKISPSHYMQENLLSTDQRRALICKQQRKVPCRKADVDLFVEPAVIVFQNYKFGDTLSFPISIRNISKTYQKVTTLMDENNVFRFDKNSPRVAKFSSGMSILVTIKFQPEDDRDYYHKLVVKTTRARFAIPIIGIGGRGLLNVSDSIIFEKVPVKYYKTTTIPVYNLGTKPARFNLSTTGQFCVKPEKGIVSPRETINLEISHYSLTTGIRDGHLLIKYDNGEEVYVYLKAETVNEDISLTPQVIQCEDTFLGMKTKVLCSIQNNSDVILDFKWSNNFMSQTKKDGELDEDNDFLGVLDVDDDNDLSKAIDFLQKCTDGNEDCDGFVLGLEEQIATWESSIQGFEVFSNENFIIQPLVGKVQPRSTMNMYVIFAPTEPIVINTTAYLDITGLEERIPLYISGKGLGPQFRFGFETLDVGAVFFGGSHCYEIPVLNIGDITGKVEALGVITQSSDMTMTVEPKLLKLTPNEHGAFYVSFTCSGQPVEFTEELMFAVNNSDELIYVTLKGSVAFPTIHFLSKEADLGLVSYGFKKSIQLTLLNDSLNYVEVFLKMEEDGVDPPVDFNTILESFKTENFQFDEDPAEFIIEPSRFALRPKGTQNITLTVCANQVHEITNKVVCYLVDSDGSLVQDVAWVPVIATCSVPELTTEILDFYLPGCYTHFPYTIELQIQNSSELSTCYCVVPQDSAKIKLTSETFVGVAAAREVTTIPVTVICTSRGKGITAQLDFYTVAIEEKIFTFNVKVDVLLSQLEASPAEIDFGDVDVMSPTPASVDIINKSPLTVHYVATINDGGKTGDVWEIDQEVGIIQPNDKITLVITATLAESGLHETVLRVEMQETKTFLDVKMRIRGIGASLEFTPVLLNELDFGTIFTKSQKSLNYEVKNVGHLPKILEWRHVKDPPPNYPPKIEIKPKRPSQEEKKKVPPLPEDFYTKRTPFKISPLKKLLLPGSSMPLTFSVSSSVSKLLGENFILWTYTPKPPVDPKKIKKTISGRLGKKKKPEIPVNEEIYQPTISKRLKLIATVEKVRLVFASTEMFFRIDASPVQESFEQKDNLKIENTGALPITVKFTTSFPFLIVAHQSEEPVEEYTYEFAPGETFWLTINFDGRHLRKDRGSVFFESELLATNIGRPGQETIKLRGEVHFPTLNFSTTQIDFGSIPNGTEAVEEFEVINPGVYCLTYKWYIKPGSTIIEFEGGNEEEDDENEEERNERQAYEHGCYRVDVYPDYSLDEDEEENCEEMDGDDGDEDIKNEEHEEPQADGIEADDEGDGVKGIDKQEIGDVNEDDTKNDEDMENSEKSLKSEKMEEGEGDGPQIEGGVDTNDLKSPSEYGEDIKTNEEKKDESLQHEFDGEGADPASIIETLLDASTPAHVPISHCISDSSDSDQSLDKEGAAKVPEPDVENVKEDFPEMEGEDEEENEEMSVVSVLGDLEELDPLAPQKAYRSKMMEILRLSDPQYEIEDEVNYLSYNRHEHKLSGPISINEVIDIIPLSGIVSAGNSLNFTVVFYGHSNIKFKTTAICHVEGGTSKTVTIQGSCQRNKLIIPKPMCARTRMTDRADGEEIVPLARRTSSNSNE